MIKRGFIVDIPERVNNAWKFCGWMVWIVHRYHFPSILFAFFLGAIISFFFFNLEFFIIVASLIEVFYLSIAVHETFHMSYGTLIAGTKFIKSVSVIPYSMETRTNFDYDMKIPPEDLCVITFAGPIFPLLISCISLIVMVLLRLPLWFCTYPVVFSAINVMSLIPASDTDGKKVLEFVKKRPTFSGTLVVSLPYFFALHMKKVGMWITEMKVRIDG